ncbi:DUF4260 domain-containing protein [Photobacterium sp. CCB-ST2H9]|uniref:DUF4260 domain-containing protein n=1 Tax=Photobacterium sp. CCB-ST2H9 TaxID=2912855 RepID=UPI002002A764|nr:DUF4260 domain-containing protein [Photobacterium sp. CCB-ST2H9]UTM58316.1 DUF4260 domain-containing protein [Photobacterium sp. CCB-ST2H9]
MSNNLSQKSFINHGHTILRLFNRTGRWEMSSATGNVRTLLRMEGLCLFVISLLVYAHFNMSWSTFAWFIFAPDLALFAYLFHSKLGAIAYNLTHSLVGALTMIAVGYLNASDLLIQAGLIWCAHIGFDRALGYGLKYASGFHYTHLGQIGKRPITAQENQL